MWAPLVYRLACIPVVSTGSSTHVYMCHVMEMLCDSPWPIHDTFKTLPCCLAEGCVIVCFGAENSVWPVTLSVFKFVYKGPVTCDKLNVKRHSMLLEVVVSKSEWWLSISCRKSTWGGDKIFLLLCYSVLLQSASCNLNFYHSKL